MGEHEFEVGAEVSLPFTAKASVRYKRRWEARTKQFLTDTCASAGLSPEAIEAQMIDDERLDDLVLDGINKAARVSDPEYRETLARVVAAAFSDEARIDEVEQLAGQLVTFDAFALRVLRQAYTGYSGLAPYPGIDISVWSIAHAMATEEAPITGALARLAGLGLVNGSPSPEHIGKLLAQALPQRDYWTTTAWGARAIELCYRHLEEPAGGASGENPAAT
ncbi:hypothetical protein [Nocardioides astragali]|uniref:Uncharacterized protein n=1 Tax=Nocardioides astragali TaxID=1776736 RepID=A0ABW2N2E7_9ACTN|nr:hypothetical protein [Nocardioides astragali]